MRQTVPKYPNLQETVQTEISCPKAFKISQIWGVWHNSVQIGSPDAHILWNVASWPKTASYKTVAVWVTSSNQTSIFNKSNNCKNTKISYVSNCNMFIYLLKCQKHYVHVQNKCSTINFEKLNRYTFSLNMESDLIKIKHTIAQKGGEWTIPNN